MRKINQEDVLRREYVDFDTKLCHELRVLVGLTHDQVAEVSDLVLSLLKEYDLV
jgi:hypothetical protein